MVRLRFSPPTRSSRVFPPTRPSKVKPPQRPMSLPLPVLHLVARLTPAKDTRTWRLSQVTLDAQHPAVRADLTASDRHLMHEQRTTLSLEYRHPRCLLRLAARRTLFLVLHNLIPTSPAASEPPRLHHRGAVQLEKVTALLPASVKPCSLSLALSAVHFFTHNRFHDRDPRPFASSHNKHTRQRVTDRKTMILSVHPLIPVLYRTLPMLSHKDFLHLTLCNIHVRQA